MTGETLSINVQNMSFQRRLNVPKKFTAPQMVNA